MIHGQGIRCDCGFEVHADDEAELVAQVQRHALKAHGMHFSPEEVLHVVFRGELGEAILQQRLGGDTHQDAS